VFSRTNLLAHLRPVHAWKLQARRSAGKDTKLATPHWNGVPASPSLNLTNLHYEVVLPLTNVTGFYRLKH